MRTSSAILVATCCLIGLTNVAGATPSICDAVSGNLIQNCGFEANTGQPADWTSEPGVTAYQDPNGPSSSNSGTNYLGILTTSTDIISGLFQGYHTTIGANYTLSFYYELGGGSSNSARLNVFVNQGTQAFGIAEGAYTNTWIHATYNFVGDGGFDDVVFQNNAGSDGHGGFLGGGFFLDDVELTPQQVPEPASLMLLGSGLLAARAFRKRRKSQQA